MTGEPKQTASKASRTWVYQLLPEKQSSHYTSLPAEFNPLPPTVDWEVFEKQLCDQNRKYRKFSITKRKPSHATTESTLFAVSKDEWNIKEGTGKFMKNILYILQYVKRHLSGQSNIEQWKNQVRSLSHCRAMLIWRHQADRQLVSQSVNQSVENSIKYFFINFVATKGILGWSESLHSYT